MIGARTVVDGSEVQLYNVHLLAFFMLGASSTMFPWQRELVADRLDASDLPTILGGDFNVSPDDPIVEQFAGHGFATVQHKVPTWRRQPYVLDHIFHNLRLNCVRHRSNRRRFPTTCRWWPTSSTRSRARANMGRASSSFLF